MAPPEDAQQERFARIDERFDEVNRRITEGREETRRSLDALNTETKALRQEMTSLHATVQRGNYTLIVTIVGALLAFFIKGG